MSDYNYTEKKLFCKKCGSKDFAIYQNPAWVRREDCFMTIDRCSKCGTEATTKNLKGWLPNPYPEDKKKIRCQKNE